jgi:hypothetical protein
VKVRLGALALEARNVAGVLEKGRTVTRVGPLAVSGMLAEQLAKELSAGAAQGAVVVADDPRAVRAPVAIRVVAGDPSPEDDAFVRAAERAEIPVVIVQLWPQVDWREPFVLSPFVVECKTGEGFPIATIARLLSMAVDDPTSLASRVPLLKDTVARSTKRNALVRAAFLGATAKRTRAARPILALEQVGLVSRMRALEEPQPGKDAQLPTAAAAAAAIAASYGLREVARFGRRRLPGRLSDTVVAVAGTWLLAEVFRRLEARGLV